MLKMPDQRILAPFDKLADHIGCPPVNILPDQKSSGNLQTLTGLL